MFDGPICGCGDQGCFEAFASGPSIVAMAYDYIKGGKSTKFRELASGGEITPYIVAEAAKAGDCVALKIFEIIGEYIGIGLSSVINLLNPEKIVIGGAGIGAGCESVADADITLEGKVTITATAGKDNVAIGANGIEQEFTGLAEGSSITRYDPEGNDITLPTDPVPAVPSSSGGSSADASVQESVFPGLIVTDKDGQRISYTSIRGNNVLSLRVGRFTASLRASLATLRQLRAEGIDTITFQTILCSTTLSVDELLAMGGVVPVGEGTAPHILAVSLVGYPSANIVTDLGAQGICISAGSACHQGKASHVVSALGLDKKTAAGVIRISFSPDNTEADVDALCHALKSHRDSRFPML